MSQTAVGRPVDILLVDDNPGDIRLTKEALREAQIHNRLRVACSGTEALSLLRRAGEDAEETLPDIIFLDLNLPGMHGLEILAEIKADDRLKRIPVVIFSTSADEQDICRAYEHSANCYVVKPAELEKFTEVVKSLVSLMTGGGQAGGERTNSSGCGSQRGGTE